MGVCYLLTESKVELTYIGLTLKVWNMSSSHWKSDLNSINGVWFYTYSYHYQSDKNGCVWRLSTGCPSITVPGWRHTDSRPRCSGTINDVKIMLQKPDYVNKHHQHALINLITVIYFEIAKDICCEKVPLESFVGNINFAIIMRFPLKHCLCCRICADLLLSKERLSNSWWSGWT